MKLAIKTCTLDMPYEEMLDFCVSQKIAAIEIGTGNWSGAPHCDLDLLVSDKTAREKWYDAMRAKGLELCALNCSGNPLAPGDWGKREDEVTHKCFKLSEYFDLDKVVMMSGLPGGGPEDRYPNWVVTSWPPETQEILDYQWSTVAIPYWKELKEVAKAHGVTKLALEPHGCQLVHDVENFEKLRDACGGDKTIGFNLDPSHLFWMGADPVAVARALGDAIYHVHVKDVRVEKPAAVNTLLDGKGVLEFAKRSWNFVIPGYGHDERWWREFLVTLKMMGYDGVLSIEHEDYTMDTMEALGKTARLLRENRV